MMPAYLLLGAMPTWASNWLTPLWLLSLGVLLGLVLLLLLWGVCFILSRIPGLGTLAENPSLRNKAIPMLTIVSFLALMGLTLPQVAAREDLANGDLATVVTLLLVPVALFLGFSLVWFTSRRTVAEVPDAVREGPLWPIFVLSCSLAAFAFVGYFVALQPREILQSLLRLQHAGTKTLEFTIPATSAEVLQDEGIDPPQHPIDVDILTSELFELHATSDQQITVDDEQGEVVDLNPLFKVGPGDDFQWQRTPDGNSYFEAEQVPTLYVRNYGLEDAHVLLTVDSQPLHPEVRSILITAAAVVGVFLLYILQRAALPKMSAIALATFKSEIAQPLFLIIMLVGLAMLLGFVWIPYNTFGEDIKVLKDSGMVLIKVLCIIQAVWAASTSIADEIEGKTALTVLSKPLRRRSFVLGKYLGIFWTILVTFILLGGFLLLITAYKPIYDSKEGASETPIWQVCHFEMVGLLPGLALAFMETAIMAAISVAISTRLPMLANFIICFAIYVIGHLTPLLVQASVEGRMFQAVVFVAQLLSTIFPVLDHFSIEAAVAAGVEVPYAYLGWALLYTLIYGMVTLLLALVLFEDRDLA